MTTGTGACASTVSVGEQHRQRRDHLDVPAHRPRDFGRRGEGGFQRVAARRLDRAVEIDAQAAHAAPVKVGERFRRDVAFGSMTATPRPSPPSASSASSVAELSAP